MLGPVIYVGLRPYFAGEFDTPGPPDPPGPTFLFLDEFITEEAAPMTSPRDAEPGPGTLVISDTAGTKVRAYGGDLFLGGNNNHGEPRVYSSDTYDRSAGLLGYWKLKHASKVVGRYGPVFGFDAANTAALFSDEAFYLRPANDTPTAYAIRPYENGVMVGGWEAHEPDRFHEYAIMNRSKGAYMLFRTNPWLPWKIIWVNDTSTDTPLYARMQPYSLGYTPHIQTMRVAENVTGGWEVDAGTPTDEIASPVVTNTFTHETDMVLEFTLDSLPSASAVIVQFRLQDEDNHWYVNLRFDGNFYLYERVGASSTLRGSAVGVLSGGERIVIIVDDETITGYYDGTQAWSYSSASNFKTKTAGGVQTLGTGGAISNLQTWPYVYTTEIRGAFSGDNYFIHEANFRTSFRVDTLRTYQVCYWRYTNAFNYFRITIDSAGVGTLTKRVAGTITNLGGFSVSTGQTVSIYVLNDTHTVLVDGAEVGSVTSSDHSSVTDGYWSANASGGLSNAVLSPYFVTTGPATDWLPGSHIFADDTFVHEPDGIIEFENTIHPSSTSYAVYFRRQDSQNYWAIQIDGASNGLKLYECVSDSWVQRASVGSVLSGGEQIRVIFDDEKITGFYDGVYAWQYTSASRFKGETNGSIDASYAGYASNLVTYPLYLYDGSEIDFNGTSTDIGIVDDATIQDLHNGSFTAEGWFKPYGYGAAGLGRFFDKYNGLASGWVVYFNSINGINALVGCSVTTAHAKTEPANFPVDSKWHHVAMTWDNASYSTPRLWVDGVEYTTAVANRSGAIESDVGLDLHIGNNTAASRAWDGQIGWTRISNNIRYTEEFTPPSFNSPPTVDANTVGQWNMNEGTGTTVADATTNANDGTLANGLWINHASGALGDKIDEYAEDYDPRPTFLLNDEFHTEEGPLIDSPRRAEPGPGWLTVTDSNNKLFMSDSKALFASGGVGIHNPRLASRSIPRATGLGFLANINTTSEGPVLGFSHLSTGVYKHSFLMDSVVLRIDAANNSWLTVGTWSTSTDYTVCSILKSTGNHYLIKGGAFSDWTLLWTKATESDDPVYAMIAANDATSAFTSDYIRVAQLPEPFDTDDGLATDSIATPAAGNTFSHEADMVLEFTVDTVPSTNYIEVALREQDTDNKWYILIDNAGALRLYEHVGGVTTWRAGVPGGISAGVRVTIIAEGSVLKGYYNNTLAWTYSAANNFITETAGGVDDLGTGGAISNLIAWPRTLSGTAATILETYAQ